MLKCSNSGRGLLCNPGADVADLRLACGPTCLTDRTKLCLTLEEGHDCQRRNGSFFSPLFFSRNVATTVGGLFEITIGGNAPGRSHARDPPPVFCPKDARGERRRRRRRRARVCKRDAFCPCQMRDDRTAPPPPRAGSSPSSSPSSSSSPCVGTKGSRRTSFLPSHYAPPSPPP